MRVLVVDDEGVVRDVLAAILSENGFDVLTAESGPQGLDMLAETPADFIITDLLMPDMSGTELLKEAKQLNPDIKVILMSGHVDFDRPSAESTAEAYATLQKPFDFRKLMDLLTEPKA